MAQTETVVVQNESMQGPVSAGTHSLMEQQDEGEPEAPKSSRNHAGPEDRTATVDGNKQPDVQMPPPLNPAIYDRMMDAIQTCIDLAASFGGSIPVKTVELWEHFANYVGNLPQPDRDSFEAFVRFIAPIQGMRPEDVRQQMHFFWQQASHHLEPGSGRHLREDGPPPLANAIREYLDVHLTQEHVRDKRSRLREFLRWCDSQVEPILTVAITAAEMNRYFHWLRWEKLVESGSRRGERGLGRQSCQNHRNVLSHFFTWCINKGWCVHNPVRSVKRFVSHPNQQQVNVEPIERQKLHQFLGGLDETNFRGLRDKLLVSFWYDFGRLSEVERLRVEDLSLDIGEAEVDTKHNKRRRIAFSALTQTLLRKYLVEREKLLQDKRRRLKNRGKHKAARALNHGYVFVSERTGRPLTQSGAYRSVKAAANRAGMPEFIPAKLRKGAAGDHMANGGSHDDLQHMMGHNDVQTTQRYTLGARAENPAPLPGDRLYEEMQDAS